MHRALVAHHSATWSSITPNTRSSTTRYSRPVPGGRTSTVPCMYLPAPSMAPSVVRLQMPVAAGGKGCGAPERLDKIGHGDARHVGVVLARAEWLELEAHHLDRGRRLRRHRPRRRQRRVWHRNLHAGQGKEGPYTHHPRDR
jgi:hypothetical protein